MSLVYYIATGLNIFCHLSKLHTTKTEYIWNVYFYIMSSLVWRGDIIVLNTLIYFITDLVANIISKKITIFTLYHHITCIILAYLNRINGIIDNKFIELGCLQEISTISLSLFYMGYIPKPVYNILFSYSFIVVRFIYYNYAIYCAWVTDRHIFNNITIAFYILMNFTNIAIAWKMKLGQKLFAIRPAIDYLCDKQPKST